MRERNAGAGRRAGAGGANGSRVKCTAAPCGEARGPNHSCRLHPERGAVGAHQGEGTEEAGGRSQGRGWGVGTRPAAAPGGGLIGDLLAKEATELDLLLRLLLAQVRRHLHSLAGLRQCESMRRQLVRVRVAAQREWKSRCAVACRPALPRGPPRACWSSLSPASLDSCSFMATISSVCSITPRACSTADTCEFSSSVWRCFAVSNACW